MELKKLKQGEWWMDEGERRQAREFINRMMKLFQGAGVLETPLLALRVQDLLVHWILAQRLERALLLSPEETPAEKALAAAADAIGKNRERIRKAMKELEEYCQKAGTPIDRGIADEMKPILEKTRDLPDAVLCGRAESENEG